MKNTFFRSLTILVAAVLCSGTVFGQGADIPAAITSDENGYVYVTAASSDAQGESSMITVAYDPDGNLRYVFTIPGDPSGAAFPVGVDLVDSLIVVAGTASAAASGQDILIAGFNRPTLVSAGSAPLSPVSLGLEQNYPNPVRIGATATIKYSIPTPGYIRLAVVNMLGKEVSVLVNGFYEQGTYRTMFQPSTLPTGTYFYMLTSSASSEVRKLILIR